jgi:arginine N-succinyltransferase
MEFDKADYLSAKDKGFIAELMPKFPIYIPLLPEPVRDSIGKVHKDTASALRYLEEQGFKRDGHVDIFDAGPRVSSKVEEIKAVKDSLVKKVIAGDVQETQVLLSTMTTDFKVTTSPAKITKDNIIIPQHIINLLGVEEGDSVRFIEL